MTPTRITFEEIDSSVCDDEDPGDDDANADELQGKNLEKLT
jgi:hypothetical protein